MMRIFSKSILALILCALFSAFAAEAKVVLVITADQTDYIWAAGGTVAAMIDDGATAYLVRVTNDDKDSWELSPEETASRARSENEEAAEILGIKEVQSLGYRAGELGGVSPTEIRDRLIFYVRLYKPDGMFFPNPYAD
jgi:LmbE family N-acetylglucosaminyl deacetylase